MNTLAARVVISALFWFFFLTSLVVAFAMALVVWALSRPFDPKGRVQHMYSCAWAMTYFYGNPFWQIRFLGRQKLPWNGGAVLASNHESLVDIPALFGLYRPFKWVSKESVFKAPFLGWNMSLNRYVPLRRGDKESIAKMMATCEAWLDRGVPVLLFPEGTRSKDGNLLPFRDGAFRLAINKQVPLFPIVITGTHDMLPKHGLIFSGTSRCVVTVLDAVSPATFGQDVEAFRDHVRGLIDAEKARQRAAISG